MNVQFFDRQDSRNPRNGETVADAPTLLSRIDDMRNRPPFFCELLADNGFKLLVGLSNTLGCAQYSAKDGSPPYLMATSEETGPEDNYMEFLTANTDTPVPLKFCLPMSKINEIIFYFVTTGKQSQQVIWEEI